MDSFESDPAALLSAHGKRFIPGWSVSSGSVASLVVPLFNYIPRKNYVPGGPPPVPKSLGVRLRPESCLNLPLMLEQLESDVVYREQIEGHPWSVVSVLSPYAKSLQLMIMETSPDRYLPTPIWRGVSTTEGEGVVSLLGSIVSVLLERAQAANETVHIGYNWSPRAWGAAEEKTGYQSVPTKWHAVAWTWPYLEYGVDGDAMSWRPVDSLGRYLQSLFGDLSVNDYIPFLSVAMRLFIERRLSERAAVRGASAAPPSFTLSRWRSNRHGVECDVSAPMSLAMMSGTFYADALKPISEALDALLVGISEAFTDMDCAAVDSVLDKTSQAPLSDADKEFVRRTPKLRAESETKARLSSLGLPDDVVGGLYSTLIGGIRRRCEEEGDPEDPALGWWRKGFGYGIVFVTVPGQKESHIRVMPGVYMGMGGTCETSGVYITRPEDRFLSEADTLERSKLVWHFSEALCAARKAKGATGDIVN
eukprot:Opistho-1_new@65112